MNKIKRNVSLTAYDWQLIESVKETHGLTSLGETISLMVGHYNQTATSATQATLIAETVKEVLNPVHQLFMTKQNTTNKQLSIFLDMFNEYLINSKGDIPKEASLKTVNRVPSNMYQAALQAYQDELKKQQERNQHRTINRGVVNG